MNNSPISPAMLDVLQACVDAPPVRCGGVIDEVQIKHGCVEVRRLVATRVRGGALLGVARASVSRTLRRLFKRGLVDLQNDYGNGLTEHRAYLDRELEDHERDPEAAYQRQVEAIKAGAPGFFPFTNAADYLAWKRRSIANDHRRGWRATWIQITDAGREAVNCDSSSQLTEHAIQKGCEEAHI